MTADNSARMGTATPTLVIADILPAARALAAELITERSLDPAEVYPLAVGAAPRSRPYAAAVIALPPRGLTAAKVAWIENAVLPRLAPGAELVVRFSLREVHATDPAAIHMPIPSAELAQLRQRAERAEAAIVRALAAIHMQTPEDITDWQRGWQACADRATRALNGETDRG